MVAVAVLAAGKGTRMKSDLPKVLHPLGGKLLVERVLEVAETLQPTRRLAIVGYRRETVREALAHVANLEFVEQVEQLGTGHAVQQVLPHLEDFDGDFLVLNGDAPLLRPETLQQLLKVHREKGQAATILTAHLPDPTGYGRVFCDENGFLTEIIEHRDCTPEQRENTRVNAGIYCFRWKDLQKALPQLSNDNDQEEYYLTDAVNMLRPVTVFDCDDYQETLGINDRLQLSQAYGILQKRVKDHWMRQGVNMIDPASVTIEDTVELTADVTIEPQTHLRGKTKIGAGSRIGPGSLVENSSIGENVTVAFSIVRDSVVANNTNIGPYSHLRVNANVGEACRIGNFVELKNTTLGYKTNASHLSYLGDATIGDQSNIGAGTITVNYDGKHKHKTVIGQGTRVGSNNSLVAPLNIGSGVTTAAGSTIVEDLPDDCLAIARPQQVVKAGWKPKWMR
ncbi:bifunctional UDP-N-acetylglucosamine diphosphorylase/glucosamine-1-phosphate N-acetyltransferase GlmU [filamentous cyanobacterium LEGE 11480]|uniref:Bifunctional protein GlmU n=2 Tax=Romeriopsis TaxID=2992131 RepID=A0A928VJW4_9CYAN|nr:bifunctional UDP-N-acetylglucosamine diphosphorylase/glucosamine-1-phosphate N-acetyltransferase GlmU [Romeriopsis navalis LEGE 11480]